MTLELSDGDHLIARRTTKGSQPIVEFEQPPTGDLTLSIESGSEHRLVQAATLWHLLLIEPEVGHKQLIPLLEILRPSWQLSAKATTIETALCVGRNAAPRRPHTLGAAGSGHGRPAFRPAPGGRT